MEALNKALFAKMIGDTGATGLNTLSNGGVHQLAPPETVVFNYTVFQRLTRDPVYAYGNTAQASSFFYQIKHYTINKANNTTVSGPEAAGKMADRTVELLTNPSLTVTGQSVLSCRFDRAIPDFSEWDDAQRRWVYSKGGIFEVWLA